MQLFPALPEVVRGMFRRPEALAVCPPGGDPRERGMFLNQTANYGLSQWEATDRILMENFNSDNTKIDAALTGLDTRTAALEAAAGGFGNCQIYCDTYTGTGSGATSVTFPQKPLFVFITGTTERVSMALARDAATAFSYNGNYSLNVDVSWTENGVTVTQPDNNMSYQCNLIGKTYLVLALVAMNE